MMPVMKKSTALVAATLLAGFGLSGCGEQQQAAAPAPQLQGELQQFSYSVGVLVARDMKAKGMSALDEAAVAVAVRDVFDGKPLQMSDEQMGAALEREAQKLMERQLAEERAAADKARQAGEQYLAENGKKEGVVTLPSGIQYKELKAGDGDKPTLESTVVAHYHGTLVNGEVFDSSYDRGTPATFALSRVVKGWQEVLPLMPVGAKWQVAIPSELAYGESGAPPRIGGNETLLFDIELIEIKQ